MTPDFQAQFRDEGRSAPRPLGTCGTDPRMPKHHRWGPWRSIHAGRGEERMCKVCSLVSDVRWLK